MSEDVLEKEAALYRRDGMPEKVIAAILLCRLRGDRKWDDGKKEAGSYEHQLAREMIDQWYKSVGKEPPR